MIRRTIVTVMFAAAMLSTVDAQAFPRGLFGHPVGRGPTFAGRPTPPTRPPIGQPVGRGANPAGHHGPFWPVRAPLGGPGYGGFNGPTCSTVIVPPTICMMQLHGTPMGGPNSGGERPAACVICD